MLHTWVFLERCQAHCSSWWRDVWEHSGLMTGVLRILWVIFILSIHPPTRGESCAPALFLFVSGWSWGDWNGWEVGVWWGSRILHMGPSLLPSSPQKDSSPGCGGASPSSCLSCSVATWVLLEFVGLICSGLTPLEQVFFLTHQPSLSWAPQGPSARTAPGVWDA